MLANQYGDCKDKHTLFAALLKASGIPAWPALIGAGIKFDSSIPSPAQFNHVITVLPQDGKYIWLDTTAEVAPFGFLLQMIRDQEALVIPSGGKAFLQKTPLEPPVAGSETVDVKSSLTADGTLTGYFSFSISGDGGIVMRAAFRQLAPSQWQAFAERLSAAWGVSGELVYRATVEMPKGFSVELPKDAKLTSDFADYSSHYFLKDGTLIAERKLIVKKPKVAVEQWSEYQKLSKEIRNDQAQYSVFLDRPTLEKGPSSGDNPAAQDVVRRVYSAVQGHDLNAARDLLTQAERISPKQPGLWAVYAYIEMSSGDRDKAIADCRKELEYWPDEIPAYQSLANLLIEADRRDEAIDLLRAGVSKQPGDAMLALRLGTLLIEAKRYAEIPPPLEKPIAAAPQDFRLQVLRVQALLRLGRKDEAESQALNIANASSDADILNDLAYFLADTDADLAVAQQLAEKSMGQTEQACATLSLTRFDDSDLRKIDHLPAVWDTLGWVYFRRGNLAAAEKYVNAAWQLSQHADVADHLGEIYDKQGRHDAAIHMWRLAVAANSRQESAKEHLRKAGAPLLAPVHLNPKAPKLPLTAAEELVKLRMIDIPTLPKQTGSAEFFLLVSKQGFQDAQFISGLESLKTAAPAIEATKYEFPFPDSQSEKIIRRACCRARITQRPAAS